MGEVENKERNGKVALIVALAIGSLMAMASLSMAPYTDDQRFREEALQSRDSETYFLVRSELLTNKYLFLDHGIQLCIISLIAFAASDSKGSIFSSPRRRSRILQIGIVLPFITTAGFIFDIVLGQHRWEFPPWADSIAIPLMGAPIMLLLLGAWSTAHLILVPKAYPGTISLLRCRASLATSWLLIVSLPFLALTIAEAIQGRYWYSVPAALWIYYFVSLAASRSYQRVEKERTTATRHR